jgi:hypothetical protein
VPVALLVLMSACSTDPTEQTRTVHVVNGLTRSVRLEHCSSADCTRHNSGHLLTPGETRDEIVQDTSVKPLRVVVMSTPASTARCVFIGPAISEGMRVRLTKETLKACS